MMYVLFFDSNEEEYSTIMMQKVTHSHQHCPLTVLNVSCVTVLFNKLTAVKIDILDLTMTSLTKKIIFKRVILYPLEICNIDFDLCNFETCNLF